MKYLPEEPHNFTLSTVTDEHISRMMESNHITEGTPGVEAPESILVCFKIYDAFEKCDFSLSCLAIKSLVCQDLHAEVFVQHIHIANFNKLPRQMHLMILLEVCHA